ncbi:MULTISPECIES: S41 family peptidase [Pelosinus]|uniref:Carboxyl-terminal protease n=1 Tax=Pelosinus fermentans B4 TaxID=1149862 RepID=I9LKJ7_9FIRM|nr:MULTISPECIES: S41 family peptidase [Pelosinus]EIW20961.1 carboxyl-terminal protease [Pelosinus fermentans B4]EIW27171.1 carboxyl-terminal protease [Pelosinus fermentans A11]OAM92912.1 carboxyl-terminal protease [Pelosinus fermentans DSM 17108]SDQ60753.1 carboxyl-terminal processing protease [Pelosinus fermentans]
MSRRKIIVSAILLVVFTFTVTAGGFLYLLKGNSSDVVSTLKFFRALQVVKARYVEQVDTETLVAGAVKGMVSSLGDPHSIYMDAKMYKDFMVETEGSFGGVGMVLGVKDKTLTVVSPIEGTPSDKAGIKSGDQILQIDGKDTKDMALDEAVSKIRGPEGTTVSLAVRHESEPVKEIALTRSNIQIKTVAGKMLPDKIGYIRISMFNDNTGNDFAQKYKELEAEGMKSIILDLRDNPGGLLEESVKVASKFVPKGPVVSVVTRDGHRETHSSNLEAVKYPVAVLVNGGSASASEIVSGAIQDTASGTLIGTKTYGKGSVQTVLRLDSGAIKLTIAKYLTPNDRSINGIGIEPDIKVEMDKDAKSDVQLDKAIDFVKEKMGK